MILSEPFHNDAMRRRGTVAVLVAVCMTMLVSIVAIVLDGALLFDERRRAQAAADAAALAGATDFYQNYILNQGTDSSGTASSSAMAVASANGYTNDGTNSTVTVRVAGQAYLGGPNVGQTLPAGYVEVSIVSNQPRYFSTIFGAGTLPVAARAVARGNYSSLSNGIIALDLSVDRSLDDHGNGYMNVIGTANVIVNSSNGTAGYVGSGSFMGAQGGYRVTGNVNDPSGFTGGNLQTGTPPVPDPLYYLPEPDPSTMTPQSLKNATVTTDPITGGKVYTLQPGVYSGGLSFSGKDSVVLMPGIYYMDQGGFSFTGQGHMVANQVMIYNDPSSSNSMKVSVTGQGYVTWSPPTSGPYAGISMFQNRDATTAVNLAGNGSFNITGTFYAANAPVAVQGNADTSIGSQYISRTLDVGGNGFLNIDYSAPVKPGTRVIQLVE